MRLQLRAALLVLATAAPAGADPAVAVDARAGIYQDTDHTFISTNTIALRGTLRDTFTIKARYLADIVSSASVDVISSATTIKHFDEIRHEIEGGAGYADGTRTASLAYVFSDENDWTSHSVRAGASHDFFQHQLTLGAGASVTLNEVYRQDDSNFRRDLTQGTGSIDATVVASKRDLLSLSYALMILSGYQASPYRFVRVNEPALKGLTNGDPENPPESRVRHAVGLRWNRHVFSDSSIRSHARGYVDDWGVVSATLGLEYVAGFGPFELGLIARGYLQDRAEFYEPVYSERLRYMTTDRELTTFVDVFGGVRAGYRGSPVRALEELRAEVKVEGFHFHYFDYFKLTDRSGIIAELGLGASF